MALRSERALSSQQGGARLEPPANADLLTPDGRHTQPWALFHQMVADRLSGMGGIRSGSLTSDATGHVSVKFRPAFTEAVTYVTVHDFAGIAVKLNAIAADQEGFTGILESSSAVLADYTTNWWAVGY